MDPGPTPVARRSPGSGGPNVEAAPRERPLNSRARLHGLLPAAVTRKIRKLDSPAACSPYPVQSRVERNGTRAIIYCRVPRASEIMHGRKVPWYECDSDWTDI